MFERFSGASREVVLRARLTAIELRHPVVGTEHLLLSMTQDTELAGDVLRSAGLTTEHVKAEILRHVSPGESFWTDDEAEALRSLGIDLDVVTARIEETFGPEALLPEATGPRGWFGRKRTPGGRFGPRAKKTLELSLRECLRLKDSEIRSAHLLLGLLREGEGLGARILVDAGVDLATMRSQLEQGLRRAA